MIVGRSKFSYDSPSRVHSSFVDEGQAKVSSIRFSLTSLPDSGKFARESDALRMKVSRRGEVI